MFSLWFLIGIALISSIIIYDDFKYREIPIGVLSLFSLILIAECITQNGINTSFLFFIYNLAFLLIQFLGLLLYYFIKYRSYKKMTESIGAADIWVMVTLTCSFSTVNFIVFSTLSLLFSLILYLGYHFISQLPKATIPLAGLLVLCYLATKIFVYFYDPTILWDDTWLITKFGNT